MDWRDFQQCANRLAGEVNEADWRSGISRSYYGVFHYFRDLLDTHGLDVGRGGQSHFNLYLGLLHCGIPVVAAIASRIDALRAMRVWADYDLRRSVKQQAAQTAVAESQAIIREFQSRLQAVRRVNSSRPLERTCNPSDASGACLNPIRSAKVRSSYAERINP